MHVTDRRPALEGDEAGAAIDQVGRLQDAFFDRRRRGDDLERRARLVEILNRAIAPLVLGRAAVRVGIERRIVGQREDLAGLWIQDHGGPALRPVGLHTRFQFALDDVLQRQIDRQLDGRPGGGLPLHAREHLLPPRVDLHQHPAVLAADLLVEAGFEPAQAAILTADVADQVRSEIELRVVPPRLTDQRDAVQLESGDGIGLTGRDGARRAHDDPSPVAFETLGQFLDFGGRAVTQRAAERRDRRRILLDLHGIGDDLCRIHGIGQYRAVPVDEIAADGGRHDDVDLLLPRARRQHVVADDLQIHQLAFEHDRPDREPGENDADAGADQPPPLLLEGRLGPLRGVEEIAGCGDRPGGHVRWPRDREDA